jgi:cyclic beta-1,2-glucan synthetase
VNEACQIDLLPQAWATLAATGSEERRKAALEAAWERLVMPEEALILLFAPPYDEGSADPGYLKGYPPGVRENGGQYTHAAVWLAMAFAEANQPERAAALLQILNPLQRAERSDRLLRYRVEPWVVAADIYSIAPHKGRGGWTWYTGAAGWLYRFITESFFGLQRHGDKLGFAPCVPASWALFKVTLRDRGSTYRITFRQRDASQPIKPLAVSCDGIVMVDGLVQLGGPPASHDISVTFSSPQPLRLTEEAVA